MTAPKRKRLGFKGMPPHPTELGLERLEATMHDIDRSVHIPIQHQPAVWAHMSTLTQFLFNQLAATRTHFGRVARVYQNGNLGWAIGTVLH